MVKFVNSRIESYEKSKCIIIDLEKNCFDTEYKINVLSVLKEYLRESRK